MKPPVPRSYADWVHCITVQCRIPLSAEFIAGRIAALDDPADPGTQRFLQTWGEAHLQQVRGWFRQAEDGRAAGVRA